MAYKFQFGPARLSGSTTFEEPLVGVQSISAQSLSASAGLEIGGTVRLDGAIDAAAAVASDSFYFFDADDSLVKKESMADYATTIAGDGLAASSGVLAVDVSDFAGTGLEDDGSENLRIAAAAAGDGLGGGGGSALSVNVDDSSIEISSDSLRVKAAGVTDAMLNDDVATGLAGNGLTATSGVLAVVNATNGGLFVDSDAISLNLNDLAASDVAVGADSIAIYDDSESGTRKETIADLMTAVAGDGLAASSGVLAVGVDDSSIEISSDALRIKAAGVTDAMLNDDVATGLAGIGLGAASGVLSLDASELSDAAVASGDKFVFQDATDNTTKKESIDDIATFMAGAGLSATNGVLRVDGNSVTPKNFSGAVALSSGYNVPDANAMGGAIIATLPAPTEVGYMVAVKAPASCSDTNTVTIQGGTMDGQTSLVLESPGAAVTLICIDDSGDSWIVM